jgi:RimJ/RimL family protein N-acetyltransferase
VSFSELVPVIETARLRLRGHRDEDLTECVAMWSDPQVTKFISGRASTEQQTWTRLLSYLGHWALMGFGYWVVEEKSSDDFVGEVGFANFKRAAPSSIKDEPELGFALASRFHGKGYATEAVSAALGWADAYVPHPRTICLVDPRNLASLSVATKCGYDVVERSVYNEQPVLVLSRNAARTRT